MKSRFISLAIMLMLAVALTGCTASQSSSSQSQREQSAALSASDVAMSQSASVSSSSSSAPASSTASSSVSASAESPSTESAPSTPESSSEASASSEAAEPEPEPSPEPAPAASGNADALRASLNISEDYRDSFDHGAKPAPYQKYIVLHDTEGEGSASGVVDYWDGNGKGVAAHFVVNKDGSIVQCVPLDRITHHAGYGDTGHNGDYGIVEDGRDDMVGSTPVGDWASDYGMNAWSVGIEMVHVGGSGDYPEEQLAALDNLIAYIDAYFGFQSAIIDHKAWRSGNSDTSPEFADYLANYQDHRSHN